MGEINFPVVGIGASAGGLKALQNFFDQIPGDSGAAYVVITHLAPQKTSAMDELLSVHSAMDVMQVSDSTEIQPDHIYVIPPDKQLFIEGKELQTAERDRETQAQVVVDVFFRSLAAACEKSAIGIILSGTGSDGTLGIKAIKEMGGITMVQDPKEAEYDGMPRSAIRSGNVDFIMPLKELAQKVVDHKDILNKVRLPLKEDEISEKETDALNVIFDLLISKTGHDFNHYKRSSVLRRLQRRMYVTRNKSLSDYRDYLKENSEEITELFKDLLITVTNFFRDPDAFAVLEKEVIPKIFEGKSAEDQVRIWITGCATGEEVYSLAILLLEYASKLNYLPQIKIFGTDISEEALNIARRGVYPETISADVSKERLNRYFHKEDSGYRVSKEIREKVLISKHDLLTDPPFLKQDLISCRNLLIYFNNELQAEVLKILHYALKPEGFLFLGMSDSTIGATEFFEPVIKKFAVYKSRQVPASRKDIPHFPLLRSMHQVEIPGRRKQHERSELTFDKIHYSLLAEQYAPASVIINDNNEVMHSSKGIDRFLHYSEGEPTRDLLKMVSKDVQRSLRNIIFRYNQMEEPKSISQKVKDPMESDLVAITLTIRPIDRPGFPQGFKQVVFEEIEEPGTKSKQKDIVESEKTIESDIVEQLESELEQTKEQLQQTIEEYETSNEELMASNEELLSMNEELQTTTEELETSKEELQSVNEELRTVNQELEIKIEELQGVNDDLKNLMESTDIGIVFVDRKLRIKRYTSNAQDIFNLIESDVNRPLTHVTHTLQYENLIEDVKQMLEELKMKKKVVSSTDGRWHIMRIKPYRTTEYNVEGAVLSFVDITDLKRAEEELSYRAGNEESLALFGRRALESEDLKEVLDKATEILTEKLNIDYTALLKLNTEKNNLLLQFGIGWTKKEINKSTIDLGNNREVDFALDSKEPVVVEDFENEERFERSPLLSDHQIASGITVIVKGKKRLYGLLGMYNQEKRTFTKHEINFVQSMATMVGQAIERIQTENELKNANATLEEKIEAQRQLQRELLEIEKKERWRIGQYLHDETAQNLVAAKTLLDSRASLIEKVEDPLREDIKDIKQLIIEALHNIRELSHFVLPIKDNKKGVGYAFEQLVDQTQNLYDIKCTFKSDDVVKEFKDITSASSVYYIAQEAIRNAINHGKADDITVELTSDDDKLNLKITDNGSGYDEQSKGKGMGIHIMKYRAELLDGSLQIESTKNKGTVLNCSVPLKSILKED